MATANLFAIVTRDPKKLLSGLSNSGRIVVFGDVLSPCSDASTAEVNAFIATPRTVKVWYHTIMTDQWGEDAAGCRVAAEATRPSWNALYKLLNVWVIADYTKLRDVSVEQFADYAAMVSLAKINPGANLGDSPTILKLLDGKPDAAPALITCLERSLPKIPVFDRTEIRASAQSDRANDDARARPLTTTRFGFGSVRLRFPARLLRGGHHVSQLRVGSTTSPSFAIGPQAEVKALKIAADWQTFAARIRLLGRPSSKPADDRG